MNKIAYIFDLETTVNGGPDPKNLSPEAHWKNNQVLMCGFKVTPLVHARPTTKDLCHNIQYSIRNGTEVTLVAHNAKFDIKYLMRDHPEVEWEKVKVWDTMTWEYRQSGHSEKFISLEDACAKYGISFTKSLNLGDLLDRGIKMEDIPKEDLKRYLVDDVSALERLYETQLAINDEWDMDYILPLAEMELNGLVVNRERASRVLSTLTKQLDSTEEKLQRHIKYHCQWQDGTPIIDEDFTEALGTKSKYIKSTSNRTVSFLLTGRPLELKVTEKWRVQYKPGKVPRYHDPLPPVFKNETNLGYPVGEGVLSELADHDWICKHILLHRSAAKLAGTYVGPFLDTAKVQRTIHPKLNTTVTGTGRLSSSAPNGQNIPEAARELIEPADIVNSIIELDFKQLEIVGAACVSGSKALQRDLNDGVDIHYKSGKKVFGWKTEADMSDKDRKVVKGVNFGLLYGGKAGGLAKQTGVDRKTVQGLIDSFYTEYPGVARWQAKVFDEVVDNLEPYGIREGEQVYSSNYTDPFSGRKFKFIEQKSPPWLRRRTGRGFSFSPQQTSNYPIQGFAGGDLVMFALTHLWRQLRGTVRFRMTVHDSIILEGKDVGQVRYEMTRACRATDKHFNLPVALQFDIATGKTWS